MEKNIDLSEHDTGTNWWDLDSAEERYQICESLCIITNQQRPRYLGTQLFADIMQYESTLSAWYDLIYFTNTSVIEREMINIIRTLGPNNVELLLYKKHQNN